MRLGPVRKEAVTKQESGEKMSAEKDFEVIVVGAGPAGSACAYTLAKAGRSVLLVERSDNAGAKNLTGGRLYTYALEHMEPGLFQEAELERRVVREQLMLLDGDRAIHVDYHNPAYNREGEAPHSYTVLRSKFDRWLAEKAEEMGAMVVCGVRVDELLEENGQVVGISAGEEQMYADVVVAADGVNSLLAQKAGLIRDIDAHSVAVGVKEIIELPPEVINNRFNVRGEEGAARLVLGCTAGIQGGGFLYTNRDSISLGIVVSPVEAAKQGISVQQLLQSFKLHPAVYPLIEGGKTVEYGAHLVGEKGYRGILQQPYKPGFLVIGDAAGYVINLGYTVRGIDLALLSGIAAAKAIIKDQEPAAVGPLYRDELDKLVLPAMRAVEGYNEVIGNPRMYRSYPNLVVSLVDKLFTVDGQVPVPFRKQVKTLVRDNELTLWQLAKDAWKVVKSV